MAPPPEPATREPLLLRIRGLAIARPEGGRVLEGVDLELTAGQIVVLLGASGSGKSTLVRAIEDPAGLVREGFSLRSRELHVAAPIGIVPQRGALFDHLSIAGNIELALRNADPPATEGVDGVAAWLDALHLPAEWSRTHTPVAHVSGGEAQRLAVARTLAGGRRLLVLDEPSVGLDPHRVRVLAALLRRTIRERGAGAIVITHDLAFAAAVADRFLYMAREHGTIVELERAPIEPEIERSEAVRRALELRIAEEVVRRLAAEPAADPGRRRFDLGRWLRHTARSLMAPFAVTPEILLSLPRAIPWRLRDFIEVIGAVLRQTLLRPLPFFAVVSTLVGYSVLYVFHRSFAGGGMPLRDDKIFELIGSRHIVALVPPLSAILFTATSGNAVVAWLGGISLTRQAAALRALGIPESRYLWVPCWLALVVSALVLSACFALGMILGGTLYVESVEGVAFSWRSAFEIVTAQIRDPTASERRLLVRAGVLLAIYAVGIAADTIAKGAADKPSAEAITGSMVGNVITCTLWVVLLELVSLPLVLP